MWKGKVWKDEMKDVILVGSLGWMVEILLFFRFNSLVL